MHLLQRLPMTMIRKLMAHRHGINQRPLALLPTPPPSPGQNLHLPRQRIHLCDRPHRALRRMPLLREPPRYIALPAPQPRVDQHVVVDAGAALDGRGGARDLQQPGGVGVEVVEDGATRGEGADGGGALLEVELGGGRVKRGVGSGHGGGGGREA